MGKCITKDTKAKLKPVVEYRGVEILIHPDTGNFYAQINQSETHLYESRASLSGVKKLIDESKAEGSSYLILWGLHPRIVSIKSKDSKGQYKTVDGSELYNHETFYSPTEGTLEELHAEILALRDEAKAKDDEFDAQIDALRKQSAEMCREYESVIKMVLEAKARKVRP
jgi:hypothetical protein